MSKIRTFPFVTFVAFVTFVTFFSSCAARQSTKMKQTVSANPTEKVESKYTGPKRRVGVVDFENKTAYGQNRLGTAAADILITELVKTGKFIVVERDKVNKILEEQKLGQTGVIDPATAAQMGKVLGLNAIVTGAISNFGVQTTGSDYLITQTKRQVAQATVDIRVVDAESGQVLYADSGKGESKSSTGQFLGMGTKGGYKEGLEGESLRAAISQLVENITSQINKKPWSTRVADSDSGFVYIDAGAESGMENGLKLTVFKLGREIRSPTTGLIIGRTEEKLGEMEIVEAMDGMSKCKMKDGARAPATGDLARLLE
ncbi:MAG: hypothetical protein HY401_07945 [Elusimicrobia bacterium]|nr:hypothetical protein [Elusimicrobiota bacterium]